MNHLTCQCTAGASTLVPACLDAPLAVMPASSPTLPCVSAPPLPHPWPLQIYNKALARKSHVVAIPPFGSTFISQ